MGMLGLLRRNHGIAPCRRQSGRAACAEWSPNVRLTIRARKTPCGATSRVRELRLSQGPGTRSGAQEIRNEGEGHLVFEGKQFSRVAAVAAIAGLAAVAGGVVAARIIGRAIAR